MKTSTSTTTKTKSSEDTLRNTLINAVREQNRANKAGGGISNKLLVLACKFQSAKNIGKPSTGNSSAFEDACKLEESFIKSDEAGRNKTKNIPRAWSLPKSNIKKAMNHGIDLAGYNTESSLRKEVNRLNKLARTEDVVALAIKELGKGLDTLPEDTALAIITNAKKAVAAMLADLLPETPIESSKSKGQEKVKGQAKAA